ncbi:L,D-transpeptidase [Longimicrobium sp.]|uniref:L,D-transpeptidase n=1 Tax=Longimicrobium sp. TaxID=2029185 RepID=UPI002E35655E|nr:L,D-transpeptidase [Longimicrobium sp.]HEX6037282.1 L,D-transpeptidase [Longimicrobium sp.]
MLRSRAGKFGILLVASVALSAALLRRNATGTVSGGNAFLPPSADGAGRADSATAAADSAQPAKPKRQIVPDVEVVVNIPSGRLQLVQGDSVVKSYPVSVGSARYPTPVGDYLLATVIWNPWWNPPPESGWARNRKPEPPGPNNPMGRVKLHMDELIYIHGTNSEGRLGAPASHGCIRMSNADVVDLARRLHQIAAPSMEGAELDRMSRPGREQRHTVMARSIRMRVTYNVAELRGDRLHVFPDVYGKGGDFAARVRGELARGGVDSLQIPPLAMSRLRSSAGARGGASFALAEIPELRPLPPSEPRETGPRVLGAPAAAAPEASATPEAPRDTLFIPNAPAEPAAIDTTTDEAP